MIILNWPDRALHPNGRFHYHTKASATKAYREAAYWATKAVRVDHSHPRDGIPLKVQFFPPDKRRRDLDGMLSSIKAGIDGIADALELNDVDLNPIILERCQTMKGGRICVMLG